MPPSRPADRTPLIDAGWSVQFRRPTRVVEDTVTPPTAAEALDRVAEPTHRERRRAQALVVEEARRVIGLPFCRVGSEAAASSVPG